MTNTPTEQIKGLAGLGMIWASWLAGHLPIIKDWVQLLASIAAIVASIVYARYYWIKTRREK